MLIPKEVYSELKFTGCLYIAELATVVVALLSSMELIA